MHEAVHNEEINIIMLLLNCDNIDINLRDGMTNQTPLELGMKNKNIAPLFEVLPFSSTLLPPLELKTLT